MTIGIRTMADLSDQCANEFHQACTDPACLDYCHDTADLTLHTTKSGACQEGGHQACPDPACICDCHLPDPVERDLYDEFGPWSEEDEQEAHQ